MKISEQLKSLISFFKEARKAKGLVVLRCDNCDSIDIGYVKGTLNRTKITDMNKDYIVANYTVRCNSCKSTCKVREQWEVKEK